MAIIDKNINYMALPSAIKRGSAGALDTTSVWYDRAIMEFYAQGGGVYGPEEINVPITAYVGQILTLVDEVNNTATAYMIVDTEGHLNEVGSATNGDNISIELIDGVLSIKDFGKKYYKYIAAVEGGEAAHYELTEGWVAGLEPRVVEVDDGMVIGWYEPNPTTAEGVKDQVVEVQSEVEQAKEDIAAAKEDISDLNELLNGSEDNPGGLVAEVEDIADILYGTEGENPVPGLIEDVANLRVDFEAADEELQKDIDAVAKNLADNYYTKSQTYDRDEIDGKIAGLFHFKGVVEELPEVGIDEGEVYQVGDAEYAWNGKEWVKLGYTIDLSSYYTKTEVDAEVKKVQDQLDADEEAIADLNAELNDRIDDEVESINNRIDEVAAEHETINNTVSGAIDRVDALEAAKEGFDTHFETVDGKIETLENADKAFEGQFETVNGKIEALESVDEGFETRIGTLETNIGDRGNFDTVYKEIFNLHDSFGKLTAQGGEPNQINGISINGTRLDPDETTKVVALPVFDGSAAGLVPVVGSDLATETSFLAANGSWINVSDMIDKAIDEAFTWESIE